MKEDIKKKFLDILFEPEEVDRHERVIAKAPLEDVKPKKVETHVPKQEAPKTTPVAPTKKTVFIESDIKKEDTNIEIAQIKEKINNKDYEFTQNISPIFGVVYEEDKKDNEPKVLTDDTQTSKPSSSYLGTVISPIFGYDATKSTNTFENYKEKMEDIKVNKSIDADEVDIPEEEISNKEYYDLETKEEKIDDVVDIETEEYYSPDDEQLFKELSISDIFKTEEEVKEDKKDETKVTYTSLFDNKED